METTGCWSQLGLVMWRQVWLTRVRRHYLVTLLELTCMVFMLSSVWEESVAPYRARPNKDQFFDSADAIEFWGRPNESWNEGTLAFAPDQAFFADLTARVCKELGSKWRLLLPLQYFVESAYIQMIAESLQKPINVKQLNVSGKDIVITS
nr:uncharacterized protein LOC119185132 [Rhipicephalus microplus]